MLRPEPFSGQYLYVSAEATRAAAQMARRRDRESRLVPTDEAPSASAVIVVLLEVIHGARVKHDPADIASLLLTRGVAVPVAQVEEVFRRYDLVKKTAPSRSPRC